MRPSLFVTRLGDPALELRARGHPDVVGALDAITDALTAAGRELDRHFWIHNIVALIEPLVSEQRIALTRRVARRIHRAFGIPPRERERLTRILVRKLGPLD